MDLLKRYRENSDDKINELASDIRAAERYGLNDNNIKGMIKMKANEMQDKYGINYWASILNTACVDDENVYNYLKNR